MSTTTHTPGKWSRNIPPASKYPVIFAGRNTHVAMVVSQGLPAEEVEANCNLIAAAPDLVEALGQIADRADSCAEELEPNSDMHSAFIRIRDDAEAAIAKARGIA